MKRRFEKTGEDKGFSVSPLDFSFVLGVLRVKPSTVTSVETLSLSVFFAASPLLLRLRLGGYYMDFLVLMKNNRERLS